MVSRLPTGSVQCPFRLCLSVLLLSCAVWGAGSRWALSRSVFDSISTSTSTSASISTAGFTTDRSGNHAPLFTDASVPLSDHLPHTDNSMTPVQLDPLDSPYPVPWSWIMAVLTEAKADATPRFRYYRSPSLISPDGEYAAYSRIQVELGTHFTQSRVASVLFLENLKTGDLHTITASSPFADNPFMAEAEPEEAGRIAILIPVAWSESGDRVLAREFESIFGSDIASDFAVVWHRSSNLTRTIAPTQVDYSNAVLLGWSQTDPNQVLFRAGNLGDPEWLLYAVDASGQTRQMAQDQPIVFGQTVNSIWAGPQAYVRP